jgi:hypothetical protein
MNYFSRKAPEARESHKRTGIFINDKREGKGLRFPTIGCPGHLDGLPILPDKADLSPNTMQFVEDVAYREQLITVRGVLPTFKVLIESKYPPLKFQVANSLRSIVVCERQADIGFVVHAPPREGDDVIQINFVHREVDWLAADVALLILKGPESAY